MAQNKASLMPLVECLIAATALHEIPGVDSDVSIGWAPAALAVVFGQLANRPGTTVAVAKTKTGAFKTEFSRGALVDAEREVYPHPGSWYGGEIAMSSCEPCGRPGRKHREPNGVFCDFCFEIGVGRTANFEPRLPLDIDTATALGELPAIESLPTVPAGWAPLVRSVLKRLGDGSGQGVLFEDRGEYLTVLDAPDPSHRVDEVRRTLKALSRERCRYCSRHVEQTSTTPGHCDGCNWVRGRGWAISSKTVGSGTMR